MQRKLNKKYLIPITVVFLGLIAVSIFLLPRYFSQPATPSPVLSQTSEAKTTNTPSPSPAESYKGVSTVVANSFSVKVPNGWRASISESPSFLAIMFARPNQLSSLVYTAGSAPAIDHDGIPSWSGLTEHFFIIMPTASKAFNSSDHLEVTSKPFTFDDGTVGQSYYVVKHAEEAKKWGGLQKDTEWQGRTYIYEKDGKRVEAHLALYPSTNVSIPFYESVVRTLNIKFQ